MRVDVGSVWMGWENTVQRKLRHQAGHQADPPLISLSPLNCQLTQGASPEALEDSEAWLPEPLLVVPKARVPGLPFFLADSCFCWKAS